MSCFSLGSKHISWIWSGLRGLSCPLGWMGRGPTWGTSIWKELVCRRVEKFRGICCRRGRKLLEKQDAMVVRVVDLNSWHPGLRFCSRHFLADSLAASFIRFLSYKRGTVVGIIGLQVKWDTIWVKCPGLCSAVLNKYLVVLFTFSQDDPQKIIHNNLTLIILLTTSLSGLLF